MVTFYKNWDPNYHKLDGPINLTKVKFHHINSRGQTAKYFICGRSYFDFLEYIQDVIRFKKEQEENKWE